MGGDANRRPVPALRAICFFVRHMSNFTTPSLSEVLFQLGAVVGEFIYVNTDTLKTAICGIPDIFLWGNIYKH